jgi:hypothetical protein
MERERKPAAKRTVVMSSYADAMRAAKRQVMHISHIANALSRQRQA